MTRRKRSVLLSFVTLMLCLALVVGGSYALFSDQVTLTTHLKAGTLDITLQRTNLVSRMLDYSTGFLVDRENPEIVDFSGPTERNVFDLGLADKIVPGCAYKATMKITNNTDVAFAYWIQVVSRTGDAEDLADQLLVTVTTKDGISVAGLVDEGFVVGTSTAPISVMAKNGSESFEVSLEFLDLPNNNSAKSQTLNFDIVVHAVQVLENPQP